MLCAVIILIILLKYRFGICLCSVLISLPNISNFSPKWPFPNFQPFLVVIFVTIAMVKFESIPEFYTWAVFLINQQEETSEKQLLIFGLIWWRETLLMHVAL